jgi:hypothetical protein
VDIKITAGFQREVCKYKHGTDRKKNDHDQRDE